MFRAPCLLSAPSLCDSRSPCCKHDWLNHCHPIPGCCWRPSSPLQVPLPSAVQPTSQLSAPQSLTTAPPSSARQQRTPHTSQLGLPVLLLTTSPPVPWHKHHSATLLRGLPHRCLPSCGWAPAPCMTLGTTASPCCRAHPSAHLPSCGWAPAVMRHPTHCPLTAPLGQLYHLCLPAVLCGLRDSMRHLTLPCSSPTCLPGLPRRAALLQRLPCRWAPQPLALLISLCELQDGLLPRAGRLADHACAGGDDPCRQAAEAGSGTEHGLAPDAAAVGGSLEG